MNDKAKIAYLSKDPAFGILTRPALELALSEKAAFRIMNIYVLDLANIHKLNDQLGYLKVNEKITTILRRVKKHYPSIIMGRVFSGDEISLVYPMEDWTLLNTIIPFFKDEKIGFKYCVTTEYFGETPAYYSTMFDRLIDSLNRNNYYHAI